jgi:hypothetical protein
MQINWQCAEEQHRGNRVVIEFQIAREVGVFEGGPETKIAPRAEHYAMFILFRFLSFLPF